MQPALAHGVQGKSGCTPIVWDFPSFAHPKDAKNGPLSCCALWLATTEATLDVGLAGIPKSHKAD
jgi:hypothetical protein